MRTNLLKAKSIIIAHCHSVCDDENHVTFWVCKCIITSLHKTTNTCNWSCYISTQHMNRRREIPWQFAALLPKYHAGTSVIVSGGGGNATVHDPKIKWNAQVQQSQEWMQIVQLTINSFRPLFPDKIFSRTIPWHLVKSLTAVKFPDIQFFKTSGHPVWTES